LPARSGPRGVRLRIELGGRDPSATPQVSRLIKIYSPAGYRHGNIEIPYGPGDKLVLERALTRLPGGTSVPASDILDRTDVLIGERAYRAKLIAFPALEPGCVLELRYRLRRDNVVFIPTWAFETTIPVRESTIEVTFPTGLIYTVRIPKSRGMLIEEADQALPLDDATRYTWTARKVAATPSNSRRRIRMCCVPACT